MWVVGELTVLILPGLVVDAHDDFMPEDIDVPLHERHWLREHIISISNQVDVEHLVVPHYAEHSFVVIGSFLREELNDDSGLGLWLDGAFDFGK